jgi:hypothetical protein
MFSVPVAGFAAALIVGCASPSRWKIERCLVTSLDGYQQRRPTRPVLPIPGGPRTRSEEPLMTGVRIDVP